MKLPVDCTNSAEAADVTDELQYESSECCYPDNWSDYMENTDSEEMDDVDQHSCVSLDHEELETAAQDSRFELDTSTASLETDLVYPGARISNVVSMLLIMTFVMTHKITGVALKDLLSLIDIHCLKPHRLIQSLYKFKQYFSSMRTPLIHHYYCSQCSTSVGPECKKCPNALCQSEISDQNKCFFLQLSISDQLKALFSRKGFYNDLLHRFSRKKKSKDNIEDIYDGLNYQQHMKDGEFLSKKENISFIWNTDGIPVFKSSKYSMWPIYLAINELPLKKRWHANNIILAGLWLGHQKPDMLQFLKPFTESLTTLYTEGVRINSPDIQETLTCRGMLLCGTCDLPAKAIVHNMMQFNGHYGCNHCKQNGKQLSTGAGKVHIYPYIDENPLGPLRTNDETKLHSHEAVATAKPVFGVKGPSWLSTVPKYNLIDGNVIDYMHCVLLGITKMLLKLWFNSEYSKELWYCGNQIKKADAKLLQIKPPTTITRVPRSIQHHRSYWKASEYRVWLLFYSLPVMLHILPNEYLAHHMLFVESVFILLQSSITPTMLKKAEAMIKHYCFKMHVYYSDKCMTANLHHLLHLPHTVAKHGPLFAYSCFPFESMNGNLLRLIKGTQYIDQQIIEALEIRQKLPQIVEAELVSGTEAEILYRQMTDATYHTESSVAIGSNCTGLGPVEHRVSLPNEMHQQALMKVTSSKNLGLFKRISLSQLLIHSMQYTQLKKRNNYTIEYQYNHSSFHGEVLYFVTDYSQTFAIVTPFTNQVSVFPSDEITNCTLPHISVYSSKDKHHVHVIPVTSIKLCVSISFEDLPSTFFISEQPNSYEKD